MDCYLRIYLSKSVCACVCACEEIKDIGYKRLVQTVLYQTNVKNLTARGGKEIEQMKCESVEKHAQISTCSENA